MGNIAFLIMHNTLRRLFRAGNSVVLDVTVIYPVLRFDGDEDAAVSDAVSRFNDAYLAATEAFLDWCGKVPFEDARTAFSEEGIGAVYTFDRRVVMCRAEATVDEGGDTLHVCRTITEGSRRGGTFAVRTEHDVWRTADLTWISRRRDERKT